MAIYLDLGTIKIIESYLLAALVITDKSEPGMIPDCLAMLFVQDLVFNFNDHADDLRVFACPKPLV